MVRHGKSILVLSATAGAGHVRAGDALAATAKSLGLPITIRHEDILDFTSPLFKKLYSEMYFGVVNRSPELWGYLYEKTEFTGSGKKKPPILKMFDHFNYRKYLRTLEKIRPDAVLCTHFLPYAAIADRLLSPSWHIPFFAVPTDYDVHSLWFNPAITRYYVATEDAAWTLKSHGMPAARIAVTGIPVMPGFAAAGKRNAAAKKLGCAPGTFTIMILSGGYGIGVVDDLVSSLAGFLGSYGMKRFQVLVVCGKNRKLYDKLKRLRYPGNVEARLYEYISFVETLMECADVLVTKSGGLTVSEALAKNLPMIIFDPIPGQEVRNADYLIEQGAAVSAINFTKLHFKMKQFIERPELLETMRTNARRIAKPEAARSILEDVLRQIGQ